MQLVLDTHNVALRQRNRSFYISAGKERRMISPHKISSIAVISPCTLTSAAVLLAVEHKIPIIFFDHSGEPEAQLWSVHFGNQAELRRAQALFSLSDEAALWAAEVFRLKSEGQLSNLLRIREERNLPGLSSALERAADNIRALIQQLDTKAADREPFIALMGVEGAVARHYWPAWGKAAPAGFQFDKRSRRPAQDAHNAALNYLYGMLYNAVESAVLGVGMDPMFGIIHADEFGAPTLVFDLIEPFRPLADALLMRLLYDGALDARHFEPWQTGIGLNREGRRILIAAFNDWLKEDTVFQGRSTSLRNHLFTYAGALAHRLKLFWQHDDLDQLRHRRRPPATPDSE
ncbi:MAG: CRISPR-associated endonuclease Cas1 [Bacteroidetes bacterium]|nr:CRISPR-associated endonuclease Cas1 [Bacteroidota bacterium]